MIDFTNSPEELNSYKGSEKKKTLIYNGKKYLVKFPDPVREKNKNISYINNAFSEYVGSNIFCISGFNTKKTILGTYTYNEKLKIVCACEDFTDENHMLYEFGSLSLSINPNKKIETKLEDILEVIDEIKSNTRLNITIKDNIKQKFFDMFVIDALIGNTDRHNGNWGIVIDKKSREANFSPIYDCGSCLNPMLEDDEIKKLNETQIKNLAINCYSCIRENNKRINYIAYIKSLKNGECNKALNRVVPKINIKEINSFINSITCMSECRRNFYNKIINYRYEILNEVCNKLK